MDLQLTKFHIVLAQASIYHHLHQHWILPRLWPHCCYHGTLYCASRANERQSLQKCSVVKCRFSMTRCPATQPHPASPGNQVYTSGSREPSTSTNTSQRQFKVRSRTRHGLLRPLIIVIQSRRLKSPCFGLQWRQLLMRNWLRLDRPTQGLDMPGPAKSKYRASRDPHLEILIGTRRGEKWGEYNDKQSWRLNWDMIDCDMFAGMPLACQLSHTLSYTLCNTVHATYWHTCAALTFSWHISWKKYEKYRDCPNLHVCLYSCIYGDIALPFKALP